MNITVQWANEEKSAVTVKGDIDAYIPKGHYLWLEYGIDVLELSDDIAPYVDPFL